MKLTHSLGFFLFTFFFDGSLCGPPHTSSQAHLTEKEVTFQQYNQFMAVYKKEDPYTMCNFLRTINMQLFNDELFQLFINYDDNKREHFLSDVKKAVGALPYLNKAMIEHVLQLSKFVPNTNIPTFVGLVQNVYVGQFKLTEAESKSFQKASRHMVEMRDQLIDFMLHKE